MMKLYWVSTEDHSEDWFIVAASVSKAERLHERLEGYARGDASAEAIVDIPEGMASEPGWPSDELLTSLGGRFICNSNARVVEIDGRKFCEGLLDATIRTLNDDVFESQGQERFNKTTKDSWH